MLLPTFTAYTGLNSGIENEFIETGFLIYIDLPVNQLKKNL